MDLRQLRYFLAVADNLHFRRAAEFLHLSQPALTLQVRALEEELGVQLLHRDRHRTSLTAAGEVLRNEARALLGSADRIADKIKRAARGQIGLLRIGFISTAASRILPPIISAYRIHHPEVELDLHNILTAEQLVALQGRTIDIGLLRMPVQEHNTIEFIPIHREPFVVVLPSTDPLARKPHLSLNHLRDSNFVMYARHHAPGFHDQIIRMLNDAGFSPHIAHETGEMYTLVSLVSAGIGVAIAPESIEHYCIPGVVIRRLPKLKMHSDIALALLKENDHPAVRAFVHLAIQQTNNPHDPATVATI